MRCDLEMVYTTRDYDAFGCLFGVMNFAGFDPVAAGRGLPADADPRTAHEVTGAMATFGLMWIGWDRPVPRPDARLHEYQRDDSGPWRYVSKGATSESFVAQLARTAGPPADGTWPAGMDRMVDPEPALPVRDSRPRGRDRRRK